MFINRNDKKKCPKCHGIGKVEEMICKPCGGYGSVSLKMLEQMRRKTNENK